MKPRALPGCGPRVGRAAFFALLLLPAALLSQQLLELRDQYVALMRMLDGDIGAYQEVRQQEREALQRLTLLNQQLDQAMGDPKAPPEELIALHQEIARVRAEAFRISADAGARREEMGAGMRRLEEIAEELNREGVRYVEPNGQIVGTWLIKSGAAAAARHGAAAEAPGQAGFGLVSFEQQAAAITGRYRLNNGRRGTLRGQFGSARLDVELDDVDFGPIGRLEGELTASGELAGQWSARELAAGRATGGTWTGRRLSFDELLALEP